MQMALLFCCWAWPPGGGAWTGPLLPLAYHGALRLDGLDVQAVLHGLASAAGLGVVLGAPAGLGTGLAVPILPEQRGAEVHIVALFLGDVSVWAMDRLHVLPEGAGVRVPLGAAWNLADVGFLEVKRRHAWGRKADSTGQHCGTPVERGWTPGWSPAPPASPATFSCR